MMWRGRCGDGWRCLGITSLNSLRDISKIFDIANNYFIYCCLKKEEINCWGWGVTKSVYNVCRCKKIYGIS